MLHSDPDDPRITLRINNHRIESIMAILWTYLILRSCHWFGMGLQTVNVCHQNNSEELVSDSSDPAEAIHHRTPNQTLKDKYLSYLL